MAPSGADVRVPRHVGLGLVVSLCLVPGIAHGQPAREINEQHLLRFGAHCFTPNLSKEKSWHHPASGEEWAGR